VTTNDYSADVRALSLALRGMHLALVDAELGDTVLERAFTGTPLDRMQRLLHDPALAWLKPVSDLMVELDGMLQEATPVDETRAREARRRTEELFGPSRGEGQHAVQRTMANLTDAHPRVTMALGDVRRALGKLPRPDAG
jgi:hypothetical protein